MKDSERMAAALAILLVAPGGLYVSMFSSASVSSDPGVFDECGGENPMSTLESACIAAAPQSFQYLVSFTEGGFAPKDLVIRIGEVVRFTNNSDYSLHINTDGGTIYPPVLGGCSAESALDSCRALAKGEYWELKFLTPGTWSYKNALNTWHRGTIRVNSEARPTKSTQNSREAVSVLTAPKPYIDPEIPAPTNAIGGYVTVMHSENGFEPVNITIYTGTKVRFRNTNGQMHVVSAGEALYPAATDGCGGKSAFDSCHPLPPGEEWSFEFVEKGIWTYYNAVATDEKAVIRVI